MKSAKAFVWLAAALAAALFAPPAGATIFTEVFDNITAADYGIFGNPVANTEQPQATDGHYGNKWGGWVNASHTAAKIVITSGDRLSFHGNGHLTRKGNQPFSYAYTIFDSAGGFTPTTSVNGINAIQIDVTDTFAPEVIRLLLRDKNGNWFLSAATDGAGMFSVPTAQLYTFTNPTGWVWLQVPVLAQADMNSMDGGDGGPGNISAAAGGAPDFSQVTGGGIYIESIGVNDAIAHHFRLASMSWMEPVSEMTLNPYPVTDDPPLINNALHVPPFPPGASLPPATPNEGQVQIVSAGSINLNITNISIVNQNKTPGSFALKAGTPTTANLAPAASTVVYVEFSPNADDGTSHTAQLRIDSNASLPTTYVDIMGYISKTVTAKTSAVDWWTTPTAWVGDVAPRPDDFAVVPTNAQLDFVAAQPFNFNVDFASAQAPCRDLTMTGGRLWVEKLTVVGASTTSTLTVSGGDLWTTSGLDLRFGGGANGHGTGNISGSANVHVSGNVQVGNNGWGQLNMTGGSVSAEGNTTIGTNATGRGFFNISNGTFDSVGGFRVGNSGQGDLVMTGGQITTGNNFVFGYSNGASGVADIQGGTVNAVECHLPRMIATGTLKISGTGKVILSGPLSFAQNNAAGVGHFQMSGGELQTTGFAIPKVTGPASFSWTGGKIKLNGTSAISLSSVGGTLAPGASVGTATFSGATNYSMGLTSRMEIEIASASSADQLIMTNGAATLAGTLDIVLLGGYTPAIGDSWDIVTIAGAGSHTGTFLTFASTPPLPGTMKWRVTYTSPTAVTLSIGPFVNRAGDWWEGL